jgi:hypothetical protein
MPASKNKVFTRDGVPEGTGSTTSVQLNALMAAPRYYWRCKTVIDGVIGQAADAELRRPAQIIINQPTVNDVERVQYSTARPTSRRAMRRSGPVGALFYEFQVSTTSNFASILTGARAEQSADDGVDAADLPTSLFLARARARSGKQRDQLVQQRDDGRDPAVQPQERDHHEQPGRLPELGRDGENHAGSTSQGKVVVDFDKRTRRRAGRTSASAMATCTMPLEHQQAVYCRAIQFWHNRELTEGGDVGGIGRDWFYDARWGNIPATSQRSASWSIYVAAGNLRDSGNVILKERRTSS